MRNRIDHWCTVEPGNPIPRVHRSSGKLGKASFPTGTVDPRVGISLSPLNTNDGFSLSTMSTGSFYRYRILVSVSSCQYRVNGHFHSFRFNTLAVHKQNKSFLWLCATVLRVYDPHCVSYQRRPCPWSTHNLIS